MLPLPGEMGWIVVLLSWLVQPNGFRPYGSNGLVLCLFPDVLSNEHLGKLSLLYTHPNRPLKVMVNAGRTQYNSSVIGLFGKKQVLS